MPSVENLRKQAKRIVRWHRTRHHPVAELIRTHLPAFGEMSDQDILDSRFQLADAQELVANQHGFRSWQLLLEGVNKMPNPQHSHRPNPQPEPDRPELGHAEPERAESARAEFVRAEPQLFVTDLDASLAFFTQKLGFTQQFVSGDPPFYAHVARGGAHINLRVVSSPLVDPEILSREEYLAASICVTGIKELFLEYQAGGVEFHQALRTEPWGARSFIVIDPDGNLILFAE